MQDFWELKEWEAVVYVDAEDFDNFEKEIFYCHTFAEARRKILFYWRDRGRDVYQKYPDQESSQWVFDHRGPTAGYIQRIRVDVPFPMTDDRYANIDS